MILGNAKKRLIPSFIIDILKRECFEKAISEHSWFSDAFQVSDVIHFHVTKLVKSKSLNRTHFKAFPW